MKTTRRKPSKARIVAFNKGVRELFAGIRQCGDIGNAKINKVNFEAIMKDTLPPPRKEQRIWNRIMKRDAAFRKKHPRAQLFYDILLKMHQSKP